MNQRAQELHLGGEAPAGTSWRLTRDGAVAAVTRRAAARSPTARAERLFGSGGGFRRNDPRGQLVEVDGHVCTGTASRGGEAGLDLELRTAARRQRPSAATARRRRRSARVSRLGRRHDEAPLERVQPGEPVELAATARVRDPVAQPRGVLVAAGSAGDGEPGEAAQRRGPGAPARPPFSARAAGLACRGSGTCRQRRLRGGDDAVAALPQADVTLGRATPHSRAGAARGSGAAPRAPPPLGARNTPRCDSLSRSQYGLDHRPLPFGAEARRNRTRGSHAQPDVEHLLVTVEDRCTPG